MLFLHFLALEMPKEGLTGREWQKRLSDIAPGIARGIINFGKGRAPPEGIK